MVPLAGNDMSGRRTHGLAVNLHDHFAAARGIDEESGRTVAHAVALGSQSRRTHPPVDGEGFLAFAEGHLTEAQPGLVVAEVQAVLAVGVAHHEGLLLRGFAHAGLVGGHELHLVGARYAGSETEGLSFAHHGLLVAAELPLPGCGGMLRTVGEGHGMALHNS